MTTVREQEGTYLASFGRLESALNAGAPAWLPKLRHDAIESFADLGFPTTHDEEWIYTNVSGIATTPFEPAQIKLTPELRKQIELLPLANLGCDRLTFVNGRYVPELSKIGKLPKGVKVSGLAAALKTDGALVERHLGQYAVAKDHAFIALNTAFFEDGAFIEIPKGAVIERPLHLLQISVDGGRPTVSHPRNLILVSAKA
jgi:Fe-S cluster assembly protein SufD